MPWVLSVVALSHRESFSGTTYSEEILPPEAAGPAVDESKSQREGSLKFGIFHFSMIPGPLQQGPCGFGSIRGHIPSLGS